jgi:antitoxin component of RelBE/YafQ-DinJ toxin-antitoxin module
MARSVYVRTRVRPALKAAFLEAAAKHGLKESTAAREALTEWVERNK